MKQHTIAALLIAAATFPPASGAAEPLSDTAAFRDFYREIVETNTTLSVGSCTRASEMIASKLKAAGYAESDVRIIVPPQFPEQGNLVAVLHGRDSGAKALLLLAHLDVVEAKREDWERDPFKLVEEDGYFYGRGASDDKSMVAIFVDAMLRYKREGYRPAREIKLALTCGEETPNHFDGAQYLAENYRDVIDAAFALNEGGGGRLDPMGKRQFNGVLAAEKVYQDVRLEITNPGGHSSRPLKDNAIYRLAAALTRISAYEFPVEFNNVTRTFFERLASISSGQSAADIRGILRAPPDAAALRRILDDPSYNAILHTTCVATMLDGGHAPNALPQRAGANVNCRILPGHPQQEVLATLTEVVADPGITVKFADPPEKVSAAPALTAEILAPIEKITADMWPGVPVIPVMLSGATDARFLTPTGIPTYGVSGLFVDPETVHTHGLNERMGVQSLYEGRVFLDRLIRDYADSR
jgi:acetylornithine deacetylase/succinyl-diaminopimelate desuccinylase-like protein